MFAYYLELALRSFKRNPGLTALMVFAIALGISVCMITLTTYRAAANNPAGDRSGILFAASIDSWDPENPYDENDKSLAPTMLTYRDARALHASNIPDRKVIMYKSGEIYTRADKGMDPQYFATRMTTADFFAMFEVPFLYGGPWDAKADAGPEPVIVLSKEANREGIRRRQQRRQDAAVDEARVSRDRRTRRLGDHAEVFRREQWRIPGHGGRIRAVFLGPDPRARQPRQHQLLEDRGHRQFSGIPQFGMHLAHGWFELRTAEKQRAFREFLDNYVLDQKKHGRFPRPLNNYLYDVDGWLKRNKVVGDDNKAMLVLAFAFLAVCLVNTVGLLLAKFLNAAPSRRSTPCARRQPARHLLATPHGIRCGGARRGTRRRAVGHRRHLGVACLVRTLCRRGTACAAVRLAPTS